MADEPLVDLVATPETSEAAKILIAYLGYLGRNDAVVPPGELPELVTSVYRAVAAGVAGEPDVTSHPAAPAVSVEKSIGPDYLICLEDGRKLKMLKRYLRAQHNMSPEEYRAKWNLPKDYPMVAPSYSERRSEVAKQQGLGRKPEPPPKAPRALKTSHPAVAKRRAPVKS